MLVYPERKQSKLSLQYPSCPVLPSNRPKANVNFVKQSSFPFQVMKRHHLAVVALGEMRSQLPEKDLVQPIPNCVNRNFKRFV